MYLLNIFIHIITKINFLGNIVVEETNKEIKENKPERNKNQ